MLNNDTAARRLAEILDAQLDLVSTTTETATTNLTEKASELHERLVNFFTEHPDSEEHTAILQLVMDMQMMLQFQDIVRQQIETVRTGLTCLSSVDVPAGENPDDWFRTQITHLEGAYVMQDQWDIHYSQLGIETVSVANGDDMTLF